MCVRMTSTASGRSESDHVRSSPNSAWLTLPCPVPSRFLAVSIIAGSVLDQATKTGAAQADLASAGTEQGVVLFEER